MEMFCHAAALFAAPPVAPRSSARDMRHVAVRANLATARRCCSNGNAISTDAFKDKARCRLMHARILLFIEECQNARSDA